MARTFVEIRLVDWPEGLARIRKEMSDLLRGEAEAESDPRVARKLIAVALQFETGVEEP